MNTPAAKTVPPPYAGTCRACRCVPDQTAPVAMDESAAVRSGIAPEPQYLRGTPDRTDRQGFRASTDPMSGTSGASSSGSSAARDATPQEECRRAAILPARQPEFHDPGFSSTGFASLQVPC